MIGDIETDLDTLRHCQDPFADSPCIQGGAFKLVLMVGDTSGTNAREWTMATVHISSGQGRSKGTSNLQKPGVLPAHFRPLPEIKHVFQQPSPRPPLLVSYIFTGIVLLPLLGLAYALTTQLGANLKVSPPAPQNPVWYLSRTALILRWHFRV